MTEPNTVPPVTSRHSTRRSVLLIVSLCINVALVGMIIVGAVSALRQPHLSQTALTPQSLMAEAPPDARARIQAIVGSHSMKMKELRQSDMAARQSVLRIFSSPSLNAKEFALALDRVRTCDEALRAEQTRIVVESVAQLSTADRLAIAGKARRRIEWLHFLRSHFPH